MKIADELRALARGVYEPDNIRNYILTGDEADRARLVLSAIPGLMHECCSPKDATDVGKPLYVYGRLLGMALEERGIMGRNRERSRMD